MITGRRLFTIMYFSFIQLFLLGIHKWLPHVNYIAITTTVADMKYYYVQLVYKNCIQEYIVGSQLPAPVHQSFILKIKVRIC